MKYLEFIYWEFRYRLLFFLWNIAGKLSQLDGIVLMYHHITNDYVNTNDSCICSIEQFKSTLVKYKMGNRKFVSVDQMLNILANEEKVPFAVVTFDDVPYDFYINAYPLLKKMHIPFVLFITIDFLDKPGFLNKVQLKELDLDPLCTIGAHTVSHPMLRISPNSVAELVDSKRLLEEFLGHKIEYMAYPYGRQSSVSRKIIGQAKKAGYKCAFGTIQAPISRMSSKNIFYLPRVVEN